MKMYILTGSEIINRMNDLLREIDCLVDMREDEGLPPFTPEEYSAAYAECERNGQKSVALWGEIHSLAENYYTITGKYPKSCGDIISHYREPFAWEE